MKKDTDTVDVRSERLALIMRCGVEGENIVSLYHGMFL